MGAPRLCVQHGTASHCSMSWCLLATFALSIIAAAWLPLAPLLLLLLSASLNMPVHHACCANSASCCHHHGLCRGRDWVVKNLDFEKVSGSVSFFETVIR